MPEYEPLTLEQALAHLRDGTGKVEGTTDKYWFDMRRDGNVLQYFSKGSWCLVEYIFAWSFRLVKEPKEPEIVKPVVDNRGNYIWIGRPRAQQERLDALVEAFLARSETWTGGERYVEATALRDFLRAEKEAK